MKINTNVSEPRIIEEAPQEEKTINVKSLDKRVKGLESKLDLTYSRDIIDIKVKSLEHRLDMVAEAIVEINKKLANPTLGGISFKAPDAIPSDYRPKGYVPQKYRQIVDEILSSEFGLDCIESPMNMDFEIQIVVPERYSSLTSQEKQQGVKDIRSRIISRALGENGVREWAMKVRDNLNRFYTASGVKSPFVNQ